VTGATIAPRLVLIRRSILLWYPFHHNVMSAALRFGRAVW
jgi:hypothetical protein